MLRLVGLEHQELTDVAPLRTAHRRIYIEGQRQQRSCAWSDGIAIVVDHHDAVVALVLPDAGGVLVVAVAQHVGRAGGKASLVVLRQRDSLGQVEVKLVEGDILTREVTVDRDGCLAARLGRDSIHIDSLCCMDSRCYEDHQHCNKHSQVLHILSFLYSFIFSFLKVPSVHCWGWHPARS